MSDHSQTRPMADLITAAPRPFDPDRGQEALAGLPMTSGAAADLIRGMAGCSPYLSGLIKRDTSWLEAALDRPPEDSLAALLSDTAALQAADVGPGLRALKRKVALLVALADLGGVWTLEQVTGALTRFADASVQRVVAAALSQEAERGRLPGLKSETLVNGGGLAILAMGKMGAYELNYSSDIDLIVLFDETVVDSGFFEETRSGLVRATRRLSALLSEITDEGYVFRTDLRLRPDPAVTPVAVAMEAAERYYASVGRPWERAAFVKARAAAGDIAAGRRFLDRLQPFVWRRHLDFNAIRDAQDMRYRIQSHRRFRDDDVLEGRNIKLGPGGIREIEFYTQTRQIIAGGRDPALRDPGTVPALLALERAGWADRAKTLIEAYRNFRTVEHRLQMIGDQQTHDLPTNPDGFARLSAFMDLEPDHLRATLQDQIAEVRSITEEFFTPGPAETLPMSPAQSEAVARWRGYPAMRSARAGEIFDRVGPKLLARLERAPRPDEALVHVDRFLAGLPAGVQVFSLFEANPNLIDLIVDIAATTPQLATYLSRNAGVFDAVIGGSFFTEWPGAAALTRELTGDLGRARDYEDGLGLARRWAREWRFRVGVHHLRGLIDASEAGEQYADIADAVAAALWPFVVAEFAQKHGAPPGQGASVIAMGSFGSRRMSSRSDLDLIVVYEAAGATGSDGPRPLSTQVFYGRLTQAFITALTAPMADGKLYEVDMRLRPSGRQGPVATPFSGFQAYQREKAWTWEHLALTRARPVAGNPELSNATEAFRASFLKEPGDRETVLADVAEMRARLTETKPGSLWDAKPGPGRLQDIALLAQAGARLSGSARRLPVAQLSDGASAIGLTEAETHVLVEADRTFWALQMSTQLMMEGPFDPDQVGLGGRAFLLRETGAKGVSEIEEMLGRLTARAADCIDAVLSPDRRIGA